MAASELGDGVACSAMAERLSSVVARDGGDGMEKMDCELVGRRMGCSCRGWPCQGIRGTWQRNQVTGDAQCTHGRRTLNLSSTVARHSVTHTSLTVQLQCINTTKPLINSKNCVHENCSPTFYLQLLFKDHSLIHHESEVTSSQSWLDPIGMVFMT